jgi:hypothetical protein
MRRRAGLLPKPGKQLSEQNRLIIGSSRTWILPLCYSNASAWYLVDYVIKAAACSVSVIPAEAGIQIMRQAGCPRIKYGAGSSGPA